MEQGAAGERDDNADDRDEAGEQRDAEGDLWDRAAVARDLRGDERDRAADRRDQSAAVDTNGGEDDQSAKVRRDAAFDRSMSSQDRQAGAEGRARSKADRMSASHDREVALADRSASSVDRDVAAVDELTGAHLRGPGLYELQREMQRARRIGQPLGLAFVDVNHLKNVNDSLGHAAGDRVLTEVVRAIRAVLRSYDLVVRFGGDEFLCVLPGLGLDGTIRRLAGVNTLLSALDGSEAVTVGVAAMLPNDTPDLLIARADADLYRQREERAGS